MTHKKRPGRSKRAPPSKELAPSFKLRETRAEAGAIMLLGPSEYLDPLAEHEIPGKPVDVRESLVDYITGHCEGRAVMMELTTQRTGESNTDLFDRILDQSPVTAFIVYWPLGCKLLGVEWELGMLVQKFRYEKFPPGRVYILQQKGILNDANLEKEGEDDCLTEVVATDEKGNRTRYHEDLYKFGCKVRIWDSKESLLRHVSEVVNETRSLQAWNWQKQEANGPRPDDVLPTQS